MPVLVLVTLLFAWSPVARAAEKVVLHYLEIPGAHEGTSQRIVDVFNQEHPTVQVVYEPVGGDYGTKLKLQIIAGTADVFWAGVPIPEWAVDGLLMPLAPRLKADPVVANEVLRGGMVPAYVQALSYRGEVYALPKDGSAPAIYYNKDLFDRAGLAYPKPAWTWEDFLAMAKKLARRDASGNFTQQGYEFLGGLQESWVLSNGGAYLDESGTKSQLTSPKTLEALEFVRSLYFEQEVSAASPPRPGFTQGKAGMLLSCCVALWQHLDQIKVPFEWDVQVIPRGQAGSIPNIGGAGFAIAATTRHPKEAWELVKFLSSERAQMMRSVDRQSFPSLLSVARKTFLKDARINATAFIQSVVNGRPVEFGSRPSEVTAVIDRELSLVWSGRESVRNAVTKAEQQINALYAN